MLDKWNSFLSKWARAVSSYGTPIDFVAPTKVLFKRWKINGENLEARIIYSPNNALRRELMSKQKDYIPEKYFEEYPFRLNRENCFLCQNIMQAFDYSEKISNMNNVIEERGNYLVLPNKYPAFIGHSLFVPKDHDNKIHRITPKIIGEDKKRQVYMPEEGKTAGALFDEEYLSALIETSDEFSLVGLSNHVRDGMSIPGHKHFHLYPEDSELFAGTPREFSKTEFGENVFYAKDSPFSSLAFLINPSRNYEKTIENAVWIMQNMEKNNEIFTTVYTKNILFVSPRKNALEGERLQIGATVPVHLFGSEEGMEETIKKHIPLKREYDWSRYIV